MKLLINDANILIDLVELDLLNSFTCLPHELHTTDFVLEEIDSEQRTFIDSFVEGEKINVIVTTDIEDYNGINTLQINFSGLSFEDCSVWYYSRKMDGVLVTGDGKLRKTAQRDGLEVRGIIFVLDELLKHEILSFELAIEKINRLYQINNRLPKSILPQRIALWENGQQIGEDEK